MKLSSCLLVVVMAGLLTVCSVDATGKEPPSPLNPNKKADKVGSKKAETTGEVNKKSSGFWGKIANAIPNLPFQRNNNKNNSNNNNNNNNNVELSPDTSASEEKEVEAKMVRVLILGMKKFVTDAPEPRLYTDILDKVGVEKPMESDPIYIVNGVLGNLAANSLLERYNAEIVPLVQERKLSRGCERKTDRVKATYRDSFPSLSLYVTTCFGIGHPVLTIHISRTYADVGTRVGYTSIDDSGMNGFRPEEKDEAIKMLTYLRRFIIFKNYYQELEKDGMERSSEGFTYTSPVHFSAQSYSKLDGLYFKYIVPLQRMEVLGHDNAPFSIERWFEGMHLKRTLDDGSTVSLNIVINHEKVNWFQ